MSPKLLTKLFNQIQKNAWLEGPQKVDECAENEEFGECDKSDQMSPKLLTKLFNQIQKSLG